LAGEFEKSLFQLFNCLNEFEYFRRCEVKIQGKQDCGENVCTIFQKNFFIPEKGLTFVLGGEDSDNEIRNSF